VKSLEAGINETSTHGLNQVLSEVENQNACGWACLDSLCSSRDLCVRVSDSAGYSSDEVSEELLVGTAGRVWLYVQNVGVRSGAVSTEGRRSVRTASARSNKRLNPFV
jgi:hypothetical protein